MSTEKKELTLRQQIESVRFREQVSAILPKHITPQRFAGMAVRAIIRTPKLQQCHPPSFFTALLTMATLGIEPDGRRAHLIPFNNNRQNRQDCQLILDYKGMVELAMRSNMVSYIHADIVCENDDFVCNRGVIERHTIDYRRPRGKAYAAYALCRFKDGSEKAEVLSVEEIEAVRKRSRYGKEGPWVDNWPEMAKKTAARRLFKWLPLSPEFRDALDAEDADPEQLAEESRLGVQAYGPGAGLLTDGGLDLGDDSSGGGSDSSEPNTDPTDGSTPPADSQKAIKPAEPKKSGQECLADYMAKAGVTFDQWLEWAVETRMIDPKFKDAVSEYAEIPDSLIRRCWRVRESTVKAILGDGGSGDQPKE